MWYNSIDAVIFADPPYTFVYAADTIYCTVPSSITPNYEALRQHAMDVLRDHNPSTCVQLFAEGRTLFQASADYNLAPTASFKVSLSGVGILCDKFVTVYFEGTANNGSLSGKKQCALMGNPTYAMTASIDCIFQCHTLISANCEVRVTFRTVVTTWASDSHKISHLCNFKIWQDWYLLGIGEAGFYIFSARETNTRSVNYHNHLAWINWNLIALIMTYICYFAEFLMFHECDVSSCDTVLLPQVKTFSREPFVITWINK